MKQKQNTNTQNKRQHVAHMRHLDNNNNNKPDGAITPIIIIIIIIVNRFFP
jgi:hypothetical protein